MLFPSEEEWLKWSITSKLHQFFVLHLDEMLDIETPDTWQVRTCNIRTILKEIIGESQSVGKRKKSCQGLRCFLAEAFSILPYDPVVVRCFPFVESYLKKWKNREIKIEDASEIESTARIVNGNLDGYWKQCVSLVTQILEENSEKRKSDLYSVSMSLAIETVARGHSPSFIRKLIRDKVLVASPEPFVTRIKEMMAVLSNPPSDYSCTFSTKGIKQIAKKILPKDGFKVQIGPPVELKEGDESNFYSKGNKTSTFLTIKISSVDQEAARHAAEQKLFQLFASLNLYALEDDLGLANNQALVEDASGIKTIVEKSSEGQYLSNTKLRWERAGTLIGVQSRLDGTDHAQLDSALQYHRLALTATSDEARFINLWVALESLCQHDDGSIIGRLCTRIPPCVAVTNLKKTIGSLARYIRFLWNENDTPDFLKLFPYSNATTLKQEDLLRVLLLKREDENLQKLFELTSRHPLICNRLYRVKVKVLNSPKSVASNLNDSSRNIEWQLRRIYRVRNEIVHKGSTSPRLLRQLSQHLHTYLVVSLQGIIYELDRQPRWSIKDALEHKLRLFKHVTHFFDSTPGDKVSQVSLLNPMVCLESQNPPFAW